MNQAPKTNTAVILAAGEGGRFANREDPKPLIPLLGIPLLERSVHTLIAAGIRHIVLVCGYRANEITTFADDLARRLDVDIHIIRHKGWREGNGSSTLAAKSAVNDPFLLVMCDHVFDPEMLRRLIQATPPDDGLILAVDGNLDNPLVDMEDVTRVRRKDCYIAAIGKGIDVFDAFDTGAFLCTRGLFTALSDAIAAQEGSLSAAVMRLTAESKAVTLDVSGAFWIDVDDETALNRAEGTLPRKLRESAIT
ncbi:MAG: NTP transferase domain-containing protein [Mariprofundaceae bacterium]|nr:NTP transferase domain-containing protein [Mariprofundaceae bacterium]